MQIKEITNKDTWEKFLDLIEEKTFLHSWNWGQFQEAIEEKIWRFGVYDKEKLVSVVLAVKIKAKRGTFLFIPHGPVVGKSVSKKEVLKVLLEELKKKAGEEKAHFIRIAPVWERNKNNIEAFKSLGFKKAPTHMHPEITWELDTSLSEEDLLMQMRKTTRYLTRQAKKNPEVKIVQSQKVEDVKLFNDLYQKVVKRHHFIPFSLNYLEKQLLIFKEDNQISIFLGKYKGEVIASSIVVFWGGIAFYHHGASSLEHPKIPVSYLLQWEAIKEGKRRGCKTYNFWGIAPEDSSKDHPWAGLTLFKKGFGGHVKKYVKTQDFILSQKYWFNWTIEKIRNKKRGF